jgi:hypothetical protein
VAKVTCPAASRSLLLSCRPIGSKSRGRQQTRYDWYATLATGFCHATIALRKAVVMSADSFPAVSHEAVEYERDVYGITDAISGFECRGAVFLLGAGASIDGGLPLSPSMTNQILEDPSFSGCTEEALALRYVCEALVKYDNERGGSPTQPPDIERLVSAVELLSQRDKLEVSPFVATWDGPVDEMGTSPAFTYEPDPNLRYVTSGNVGTWSDLVTRARSAEAGTPGKRIWSDLHLLLLRDLRKRVHIPDITTFSYLEPLIALGRHAEGVTIATLNYDLSIEGQAELLNVPCHTGIRSWVDRKPLVWPASGIQLLKLHGSVGWSFVPQQTQFGQLDEEAIVESSDPLGDDYLPAVVYGQREKLRARGPFLELLGEFQRRLAKSDRLVVVGYSFQDAHVNEIIRRWVNGDPVRRICVIDPSFPSQVPYYVFLNDFRISLIRALVPQMTPSSMYWSKSTRFFAIREGALEGLARLIR